MKRLRILFFRFALYCAKANHRDGLYTDSFFAETEAEIQGAIAELEVSL